MSKLAAAGLSRTVAGPAAGAVAASASRAMASARRDGLLEGGRARSMRARPAARKSRLEARAALADQHRRDRALGDDRRQARTRSTPLSRPPAISTTGGVEGAQRGDDGVGLGALRVVDEADAIDDRDRLEAVLDAGEGRGRRADRVGRDTEQRGRPRWRPARSRRCGRPGWRARAIGMIRPPGPVAAVPPPASASRSTPAGHDPAVDHAEPAGDRARRAGRGRRRRARPVRRTPATTGSSALSTSAPFGSTELGEPALDRAGTPRASRAGRGGRRSRWCRPRPSCPRDSVGSCSSDSSSTTRCAGRELRAAARRSAIPMLPAEDDRVRRVGGEDAPR